MVVVVVVVLLLLFTSRNRSFYELIRYSAALSAGCMLIHV